MPLLLYLQKLQGRGEGEWGGGGGGGEEVSLRRFGADQKIASSKKKCVFCLFCFCIL